VTDLGFLEDLKRFLELFGFPEARPEAKVYLWEKIWAVL
jgi:hypothetical protein